MWMMLGMMPANSAPVPEELEQLLLGVAAGDREALSGFYARTRTAVYGLALSYLRSGHDAEDVTQDTYLKVWDSAGTYRPQGKPMAWLLTITRNLSLMRIRSRDKVVDMPQEDWNMLAVESSDVTAEDRQVLTAALYGLTDQERRVVLLHAVSGLKHREIAQILEMPLATVLSKYHRALKKLRDLLEGDEPL